MPTLSQFLELSVRLLSACLLGGIIGYQRERIKKPAGLKTHIVVCVASALVMLLGEFLFVKYGSTVDPSRLGAQVISGLGFLGAGAIIKEGFGVRGLTTAASIWTVSCIGLACGAGYYIGSIVATLLILLVLVFIRVIEKRVHQKNISNALPIHDDEVDIEKDDDL